MSSGHCTIVWFTASECDSWIYYSNDYYNLMRLAKSYISQLNRITFKCDLNHIFIFIYIYNDWRGCFILEKEKEPWVYSKADPYCLKVMCETINYTSVNLQINNLCSISNIASSKRNFCNIHYRIYTNTKIMRKWYDLIKYMMVFMFLICWINFVYFLVCPKYTYVFFFYFLKFLKKFQLIKI